MPEQTSEITNEYIMTVYAPLEPPQVISADLHIFNVKEGGWAKGPSFSGKVIGPSGDWGRVMSNGTFKLDVRSSIEADDGSIVFVTYTGRIKWSEEVAARFEAGETITAKDMFFMISPTYETVSERYGWLNDIVAIGKGISVSSGKNRHVTYEIFAVR